MDRDRAQAVLDADGKAKGILLTEREKSHLGDVVKFRGAQIDQINSVIASFESSTSDNRLVVAEYRGAVRNLESLLESSKAAATIQKGRNDGVLAQLIDPVAHLDTLIALAGEDEARVERAQLMKTSLS